MKRILKLLLLLCLPITAWATVPIVPYTVTYTCAGGFGPFSFTYPISDPTALTVTLNGTLLATTSYTVIPVNNNYNNGGSVTLGGSFPCTSGQLLVLTRVTPLSQATQFYDNMPALPGVTGSAVDKLTEIVQELNGNVAGLPVLTISGAPLVLPHTVVGSCVLGTSCSVTLTGNAIFTSQTSYQCTVTDQTAASAAKFAPTSGTAFVLTGTGTDTLSFVCVGY